MHTKILNFLRSLIRKQQHRRTFFLFYGLQINFRQLTSSRRKNKHQRTSTMYKILKFQWVLWIDWIGHATNTKQSSIWSFVRANCRLSQNYKSNMGITGDLFNQFYVENYHLSILNIPRSWDGHFLAKFLNSWQAQTKTNNNTHERATWLVWSTIPLYTDLYQKLM